MRDEAAELLEPCWAVCALSHVSLLHLLLSERRADKRVLNDSEVCSSSSTDPMNTPFVLPRGDRSGNSGAAASAFYFVGLLKLASFFAFCPSQSIHSVLSFLPGDDDDPYLENGFVWVVPWGTTDHV
jgi:hypothetical protein